MAEPQADLKRDLVFSPSPDLLRHQQENGRENGQPKRPPHPPKKTAQPQPRPAVPHFDISVRHDIGPGAAKSVTPVGSATAQNDQGLFGRNNVQFRTEKNFQTPEPLRRTDCYNEDECADYSGFPKFKSSSKTTAKNVRKPYLGLSISTPIQ